MTTSADGRMLARHLDEIGEAARKIYTNGDTLDRIARELEQIAGALDRIAAALEPPTTVSAAPEHTDDDEGLEPIG